MSEDDARPATSPVPGRDDLTCPVPRGVITGMLKHARAHPWPGNQPLTCPAHMLDTFAITEPGRPLRMLLSLDTGYHASGWFANSDYESCLHLSLSHPRSEVPRAYIARPELGIPSAYTGPDLETVADDEARAWGLVFFSPEHAPKAWFEPAASPLDPYRAPNVVHLRLFLDQAGRPVLPRGEVYHLRPWADGTSPAKITEGRAGADVR